MKISQFILVLLITLIVTTACKNSGKLQESLLNESTSQTLYNISYGDHMRNSMDIALPKNRTINTPVVIFIHGGAWIMGNKNVFFQEIKKFSDAGIACATINYRYASNLNNHHHTELLNDIRKAVDFIASKSEEWKVSTSRFGLVGQSAGGHLALMTAYTKNNDQKIKACVSWAGPVNFIDNDQLAINSSHEVFKLYVGAPLKTMEDTLLYKEASPYWSVKGTSVPTLLIHGTADIGVPHSNIVRFKDQLDRLEVKNEFVSFEGGAHLWIGNNLNDARNKTLEWFQVNL